MRYLTVQIFPRDGKCVWREQDCNDPGVPEYADELEWLAEAAQAPLWLGEALGRAEEAAEADEAVCGGAGDTGCGDEGCERHT